MSSDVGCTAGYTVRLRRGYRSGGPEQNFSHAQNEWQMRGAAILLEPVDANIDVG